MTEITDSFHFYTKQGLSVLDTPENTPLLEYREFFSVTTPDDDERNIYLNTRGWMIMGDHFDDSGTITLFHPDELPDGLKVVPIGGVDIDGDTLREYVVYNPDTAHVITIQGGIDKKQGLYTKGTDLDVSTSQQDYEHIRSSGGLQVFVKTKIHAVEIPQQLLKNKRLRSIVETEMNAHVLHRNTHE